MYVCMYVCMYDVCMFVYVLYIQVSFQSHGVQYSNDAQDIRPTAADLR